MRKNNPYPPVPEKSYSNSDAMKAKILLENKNKSGVYMWKNLTNGKCYVGSSVDLRHRFSKYFNVNHLLYANNMYICRALLKHGYAKFSLDILEYCEAQKCLKREDYYLKLLNPEYNTSQNASAPMFGLTHSEEVRKKMSIDRTGKKNPRFGKPRAEGAGSPPQKIEVTDLQENTTINYDSISEAARALNLPRHTTIANFLAQNQKKPYRGRYFFRKVD